MAFSDWIELDGSLDQATLIDRGYAETVDDPDGNDTVYAFASRALTEGVAGLYCNRLSQMSGQPDYNPMAKGGRIVGAVQRAPSGGVTGFAPMLFIGLQGTMTEDTGYILGLSDSSPHRIILRKGKLTEGVPDSPVGTDGVLARGTQSFPAETWHHLRLDMIVNDNGDTVLLAFQSDLDATTMPNSVWSSIPGMEWTDPAPGRAFIDDSLGVNSGSAPYTNGRAGFAFQCNDVARRAYFTRLIIYRQLP